MKNTGCYIILVTALLLSCYSSLKVRKLNSIKEAANWNESKDACPPGYQCLLKQKAKSNTIPMQLFKINGSKNFNKLHGDVMKFDGSIAGSWHLVINQHQYALGMAQFFDHDLQLDLIGEPANKLALTDPDYRSVGIDEHLQIIAKFSYFFSHDVEVWGYGLLE